MFDLSAVQAAIRDAGFDGWLLYDFRGHNVLAQRVAGVNPKLSRRWFYFVPVEWRAEEARSCHRAGCRSIICPGSKTIYRRWQELEAGVGALVKGAKRVAMEYSPRNANPYIGRVDAGTIELVKSFGCEVVPSGDLIQLFEATWDDDQEKSHFEAAKLCRDAYDVAFRFIADEIKAKGKVMETAVQARIMKHFADNKMTTYSPPIVGVGPHSGDPHFDTSPATDMPIERGSFVLIDLWAKMDRPRTVYADYTRVAFVGESVPAQVREDLQHRRRGPRRRDQMREGRLRGEEATQGMGGGRCDSCGDREGGLRRPLHAPHRPQHRPGGSRQRRAH